MKNLRLLPFLSLLFLSNLLLSQDLKFAEKPIVFKGHKTTVNKVLFSPNGKELFSCGGENQIIVFDSKSGEILRTTPKNPSGSPIKNISVNYNGTLLVSGGYNNKKITILSLSDLSTKKVITDYKYVDDLCFSNKNNNFVVVGPKKEINKQVIAVYNSNGEKLKELFVQTNNITPTCLDYSPNEKYIASGVSNEKQGVYIYDATTFTKTKFIPCKYDVGVVKFSPDGNYIAGGCYKDIYIWEVKSGKLIKILKGLNNYILTLDFSPNGKYIVAAGMDHTCTFKMWDISSNKIIQSINQRGADVNSLCFSPNGKSLAVGIRTYGDLFDVTTTCVFNSTEENANWNNVVLSTSSISIDFPIEPKKSKTIKPNYEYSDFSLSRGGYVYQVRATKYLYTVNSTKRKNTIDKKIAKYKLDKTNISQSNFTLNGETGIDLIGYKNNLRYHYKLIFIDDVYYYILFKSKNNTSCSEETMFLNSLKRKK